MKKLALPLMCCLLAGVPLASAQEDRGEQTVSTAPARPTTEVVAAAVSDGKSLTKEVIVAEESEKWWSVGAGTGWDSLYMFRGVNVLGNGNGIYWINGSIGVTPWENGSFTTGLWYGVGTGYSYREMDLSVDYTHSFGPLSASFGWLFYFYPDLGFNGNYFQNELYWKLAYDQEVGPVTLTPAVTYYYNLGPTIDDSNGITKPGASFLSFRLDGAMPLYKDIVSLAPWTAFNVNFEFNGNNSGNFFSGGNNWELGLALPVQITEWFGISGYVAYSYQWQDLYNTDPNTVWAGASANFSF